MPVVVVKTHAHNDDFFGNAVFAADGVAGFWGHQNCAGEIDERGDLHIFGLPCPGMPGSPSAKPPAMPRMQSQCCPKARSSPGWFIKPLQESHRDH